MAITVKNWITLLGAIWMQATICSSYGQTRITSNVIEGYQTNGLYTTNAKQCHQDGDSCLRGNTCCNPKSTCMPKTARCEVCSPLGESCNSTPAGCCWKFSNTRSGGALMCGGDEKCIDASTCLPPGGTGCSKSCCAFGGMDYNNQCVNDVCIGTAGIGKSCDPGNQSIKCKSGSTCRNGVCKEDAKKDACQTMVGTVGCYEKCLTSNCRMACDFNTMMCAEPVGDCKVTLGSCNKDHSKCCDGYHCVPRGRKGPFCGPCEGAAMANFAGQATCRDAYSIEGCKKCGGSCDNKRCILPKAKPKPAEPSPSDAAISSENSESSGQKVVVEGGVYQTEGEGSVPDVNGEDDEDDEAAFAWNWDAVQIWGDWDEQPNPPNSEGADPAQPDESGQ